MRIGGVEVKGPNEELLVLPRQDQDVVIRAKAVLDMEMFEKLCPEPKPPGKRTKDGWVPNPEDTGYKTVLEVYQNKRLAYLILKSLEPSNIEWDTVVIDNPGTWTNYLIDLKNAGLSTIEVNRIITCIMQANALDEKKLEEARKVFLRGQAQDQNASSGLNSEPVNMPSGTPVSDSV